MTWLLVLAFLIGSIPFGLIVSAVFFKRDLRAAGSGNIGAANALRTLGKKAGLAVLALDALKGVTAIVLASHFASNSGVVAPLAGFAAVLGHCYTPWLRFRGGKGVATFLGATSALSWESGIAFGAVWLACVLPTGFSSVGSILGVAAAATVVLLRAPMASAPGAPGAASATWVFAAGSLALILWKHRENLARLRAGTESRLQLLKR